MTKYPYYALSALRLITGMTPVWQLVQIFTRTAPPGPYLVGLRGSPLRFKARSAMDIWSAKETFLDRFYEKFGFKLQPGWTIVDIGGGIGEYTLYAALAHPDNRVVAFEPTPSSFTLLQENLQMNHVNNVQALQQAVWSEDGEVLIDTASAEPSQFTSGAQAAGGVAVPAITLQHALQNLELEQVDLLKLDCEGAEYAILFNTQPETLRRIRRIVMEYHDIPAGNHHNELVTYLQAQGYRVETYPNYVHSHLGYLRAWQTGLVE